MRTYCGLSHIFIVLLLCDYGMFYTSSSSSSSPSSSEESITATPEASTKFIYDPTATPNTTAIPTEDSNLTSTMTMSNYSSTEGRSTTAAMTKLIPPPVHSTGRPITKVVGTTQSSEKERSNTGKLLGVIILIFIVILIIILLGVLYFLRKKGRSYSFDLTHASCPPNEYDTPLRSVEQQGVSYEHTDKDLPMCLDYIQEDKSEDKDNLMANGCTGEKTEQTPASENEQQNVPDENSFSSSPSFTPPMKKVEFNLDLDLIGIESDLNSPTAVDGSDAPHSENNNHVSIAGKGTADELFTEINLDESKEQA
ncbi:uncharacterized protein LOC127625202 [Xyrauchen texanus]|uniref:uncharacterized protein LOC127625202 n=1 Tax=Xyrauchen texanus TaxID=154827 RepID=UPI002242321D|nr:uncharacterized protein LOC127625202 [Xyrauchen texanus]